MTLSFFPYALLHNNTLLSSDSDSLKCPCPLCHQMWWMNKRERNCLLLEEGRKERGERKEGKWREDGIKRMEIHTKSEEEKVVAMLTFCKDISFLIRFEHCSKTQICSQQGNVVKKWLSCPHPKPLPQPGTVSSGQLLVLSKIDTDMFSILLYNSMDTNNKQLSRLIWSNYQWMQLYLHKIFWTYFFNSFLFSLFRNQLIIVWINKLVVFSFRMPENVTNVEDEVLKCLNCIILKILKIVINHKSNWWLESVNNWVSIIQKLSQCWRFFGGTCYRKHYWYLSRYWIDIGNVTTLLCRVWKINILRNWTLASSCTAGSSRPWNNLLTLWMLWHSSTKQSTVLSRLTLCVCLCVLSHNCSHFTPLQPHVKQERQGVPEIRCVSSISTTVKQVCCQ